MFRRQDPSRARTSEERARAAAERAARRSGRPLPPEAFLHETPPPPLTEAGRASSPDAGGTAPPDEAAAAPPPFTDGSAAPDEDGAPPEHRPTGEPTPSGDEPAGADAPTPGAPFAASAPNEPEDDQQPQTPREPAADPGSRTSAEASESPRIQPPTAPTAADPAIAAGPPPTADGPTSVSDHVSSDSVDPRVAGEPPASAERPEPDARQAPVEPPAGAADTTSRLRPIAPDRVAGPAALPASARRPDEPTGEASPQRPGAADAGPPSEALPVPADAADAGPPTDATRIHPAAAGSHDDRDASERDEADTAPADNPPTTAPIVNQPTVAFTPPDAIDHGADYRPEPAPAPQSWIDGQPQGEAPPAYGWPDDEPPAARPPLPRRRTEPPVPPRRRGRRPPPRARMPGQPAMPARGEPVKRRRGPRRILALLALAAIGAALWFINSTFQPFHDDGTGSVSVTIPEGADAGQIGDTLAKAGVVDSGQFFMLNATLTGRRGKLKPGDYTLRRGMSNGDAVEALQQGPKAKVVQTFTVTLPEGRTRRELKPVVDDSPVKGNYVKASQSDRSIRRARRLGLPRGIRNPDGFLFPATYELLEGATAQDLVDRQLKAFADNRGRIDMRNARRLNLTPYDVVIIASMVEREASLDRERPLVAAVIHNRLRQGIPLGIDATIRYVENNWTEPLRQSELERDTPYNTRLNQGLPPTPIGNPGLKSLQAAAKPAKSDFLYYVVKPGTCGEHAFSSDYDQFLADQARYNAARDAAGGQSPTNC